MTLTELRYLVALSETGHFRKAADACKATLSTVGQEIYTAALAQNPTAATGRSIVTKEVEKLIGEGKVSMSDGRKAGEAVGVCLKKLK